MIKPISTWTRTFYKLGYILRRVWPDDRDYSDNYAPLALEVLEERQMLSGFGGDDPFSGGGTGGETGGAGEFSGGTPSPPSGDGTGGNGAASPASPGGGHSSDRFNGIGDFSNGLQLPGYWESVLPAHFSFTSYDKINFRGTVADGVYSFSERNDETSDNDEGAVTLSRYEFTVTVTRQGGNYYETLTGQMTRYTLTSLDASDRDGFSVGNSYDFSSKGRITYTSNINYTFSQNFSGLMLTGVNSSIIENTDTQFNWNAQDHKHFTPTAADYSITSNATFQLTGATHGYDQATFQAIVNPFLITFQTSGTGYHRSGARGTTYANSSGMPNESAWLISTVGGTTTAEVGNLPEQGEGHRIATTMEGTVKSAFSNNYNFNGSGQILAVSNSSVGSNGWVADATIIKTQNTSSQFKNDLTTDFASERFIINAAVITNLSQTASGEQRITGQFIVNLGDDANVRNTNRETQTRYSTNKNTGHSNGHATRMLRYKPDGSIVSSAQVPDSLTQHIDVDRYDESTHVVDVYVYAANGFTHDRYDTDQDTTTTGAIDLTMTDGVSYTTNQVGYHGKHNPVGKQTTTGNRDLTMKTNTTSIHKHRQEHQIFLSGSLVEVSRAGGSGNTTDDSGSGDGSNLIGPDGSNPGGTGGADGEPPPPSSTAMFYFTDKRDALTTITLRTESNEDSTLDIAKEYFEDGSVTIVDRTAIETTSEFRPGSQVTINNERWHNPTEDSDPNNHNAGYTHTNEQRNFFGFSKSKLTNDLTWKLTPVAPPPNSEDSTGGDLIASATGISGGADNTQKFTLTTTGTETLWREDSLSVTSTEHGSQWLDQMTIASGTKTTVYSSGNWSGSGTTNDYGNSTTTTEYFEDNTLTVTNVGNSRHDHTSNKTLTTTSHRGISSGDIPSGYPDPHSRADMTVADATGLKDAWSISIRTDSLGQNLADIEGARDSVNGTFSIQRDYEKVTQQIHASETGSTNYNFKTTYTPKPASANNYDDANLLAEPSVGTGTDAAGAVKQMWNLFDIEMDGTLVERSDVKANTSSDNKLVIKYKFDQKEGNHTSEMPSDFLTTIGNNVLPEFLNRNEVRSFSVEINDYETNRTVARTIDNKETKFTPDGKVTRKTLPKTAPSDEGDNNGGGNGDGNGEGGALSAPSGNPSGNDDYLYHEYLNESKIKRSKFEQEAVWMDSIRDGHGYFSFDTSNTQPISGPSSSNIQALRIERNLTFVESLGSYFGIDDNPDTIGSSGPTASDSSGSSTGGSAGTASFPPGSSDPNSHLPAVGDGSMTGNFRMITTDAVKSDYQWKQTSFSRFANATFSHVQKDITKIGNQATHSENRGSEYVADFLENGRTSYHTETTKATASEWNNTTFGASISDYRLGGSTTSQVHSTFQGNHTRTTVNRESDTGESVHDNVGKTMTTATFAAASANGFASQTTTEKYVVVPLLTMNSIIKKVTTETITESVTGTYLSEVNLLDISGYGSQYSGGIQLSRTTGMTSVSSFTMQPPVTQAAPANSETKHWGGSVQLSEIKTFAYGSMEDPDEYSAIVKTLSTRFWGTLKLAFGVAEVAVGTAAVYTGVGAPFGVIAIVHGLDTMYAGAAQVVSGTESDTLTKRLANSVFLASFKPANEQEKQQLEMFGEGIDSLVGIVGGLGGMGGAKAAFNGAKQLKQGGAVAKTAAGQKAIDAAGGVGTNLRNASFSSKVDDLGRSDIIATFSSRDAWKGPFGGAKVARGYKGQAHTGLPKYELSDSWLGRLIGAKKVSYPDANYGVVKNLSASEHAAVTRHELAHIRFFHYYPEVTHLAGRVVGTPGQGVASFIIEFHGNMAEHSGKIGKAFFGALLKDTDSIPMVVDGVYATGFVLSGYYIWKNFSK